MRVVSKNLGDTLEFYRELKAQGSLEPRLRSSIEREFDRLRSLLIQGKHDALAHGIDQLAAVLLQVDISRAHGHRMAEESDV